jgi:hypothetical protein
MAFLSGNNLASHTLGFVGYKGMNLAGVMDWRGNMILFFLEMPIILILIFLLKFFPILNKTLFENQVPEGDIVTTIEPQVQSFLEKN